MSGWLTLGFAALAAIAVLAALRRGGSGALHAELALRRQEAEQLRAEAERLRTELALRQQESEQQRALAERLRAEGEALRTEISLRLQDAERQRGELAGHAAELERQREARSLAETQLAAASARAARVPALEEQVAGAMQELASLRAELARLQQAARGDAEKIALLQDARAGLAEQFKVLAEEVMGRHGESFKSQNREQLDALLAPLRDQLQAFQGNLQNTQLETARERERLAEQVKSLVASSATMSEETRNLTQALKGDSRAQGAWGEMVLARILEMSGLRKGTDYVVQESLNPEGGGRVRPDVIVNLPDDKRIVIDAKVSLTAFSSLVAEGDPDLRQVHIARHVQSVRAHVKELSRKEYARAAGSDLDFVIMFVPIEGALAAALDHDPGLAQYAAESGVTLGTPTTLMIALRTVASVWQVERRNRNAEQIAERAGRLYDKLAGFVADMRHLGHQIERVRGTYDGAMGKLAAGQGNVLRQAEMLRALGARTGKALPTDLLGALEEEDSASTEETAGPVQPALPGTA